MTIRVPLYRMHLYSPGNSLYPNSHGGVYDMMGAPDFEGDDYVVGENLSSDFDHDDLVHIRRYVENQ